MEAEDRGKEEENKDPKCEKVLESSRRIEKHTRKIFRMTDHFNQAKGKKMEELTSTLSMAVRICQKGRLKFKLVGKEQSKNGFFVCLCLVFDF